MSSPTLIDIPLFIPNYDANKSYGYKNSKEPELSELLYKTTSGYCMYCYVRIELDSKRFGHLEHAIEKKNSNKLTQCIPNIGLACPKCNDSFKKNGDNIKIFTDNQIQKFEKAECTKEKCTQECSAYKSLKRIYLKKRKIILQPMGVKFKRREYRIQYNLLKLSFEPNKNIEYTDEEKAFIQSHIDRFNLNDSVYRTREILRFCKDIANGDKYLRKGKYNNYIVDLFIDKIKELNEEEIKKLCSDIYELGVARRII